MKKILFIIFMCSLLGACQVNELTEQRNINEIYARIECDIETKTCKDADNNIRWSEGDQVAAFMKSSLSLKYQIKPSYVGKTSGCFSKISSDSSDDLYAGFEMNHNVLYYPYGDDIYIERFGDDYHLNVVLPAEQTYSENSFGNGAMPMLAVSEGDDIVFKNICGGMKLKLKGNKKITSIKLDGKNNEKLSGTAILTAYADGKSPTIEMSSDASASVILDCGAGVQLTEDNITEFIIALPPVTFRQGFTVSLTDAEANIYTIESNRANLVRRSSLLVMPVITLGNSGPEYPEEDGPATSQGHNTEPYFSETVELMGLLWHIAGFQEYCNLGVESVALSANSFFASMMNHQAVRLAKQYGALGIRYDAVTAYANQLIFNDVGDLVFDPDYLEGSNSSFDRWNNQQKDDMLAAVNDFYKKSNFHEWFVSTREEQQQAIASFKTVCNMDYTWFDTFYGKNDKISSRIILSFMIGGSNNGISLKRKDGTFLLTPVIGSFYQPYGSGQMYFNGDMNLVVHEFSHPYCNPLIEEIWSAISIKADEVYTGVESIMQSQAYGSAKTMMCETLVRASAIRYMISHDQMSEAADRIYQEESNGFMMIRCLVNTLEKYESNSDKYETLADFMPELIVAINNFDPNLSYEDTPEPDTLPHDYVDLGIEMEDGRKLYFATRNVGETSPGGIGSSIYLWGSLVNMGSAWAPPMSPSFRGWPDGHRLDAEHDIAAIEWGGDWHVPSPDEWEALVNNCFYEIKYAEESGYGITGYFFYSKNDRNKFIFLPVTSNGQFWYWTSEIASTEENYNWARIFNVYNERPGCFGACTISDKAMLTRPVIAAEGVFDANNHEYVDLDIKMQDGRKLYFATMNIGETSPGGSRSHVYCWGATEEGCFPWVPESYYDGKWLDAAHDVATQTWGEKWHVPSPEEWRLLVESCDYERKEAHDSGYGVAGYFFYNKSDHSKFIFLPIDPRSNALMYWSSLMSSRDDAYVFTSEDGYLSYSSYADVSGRTEFAIRPVFVE